MQWEEGNSACMTPFPPRRLRPWGRHVAAYCTRPHSSSVLRLVSPPVHVSSQPPHTRALRPATCTLLPVTYLHPPPRASAP
eukprot:scaffold26724_cov120-Isochrysis_galbana.AAC.12